ncbi:TPA: hypothetical protein N0F65_006962 [Lagenidium giganteum]|uniref:Ubiquitin-like domain-containing protein n=1 Tax=Lagenidium giganteum TaxID=4803 RepID=A0AAV2ZH86_9STRA|nr:TPA: hypothetical protein N0F65_006962 [Lagenidium giganteum]
MMEPEHVPEDRPLLSDTVSITVQDEEKLVLKVKTMTEKPLVVEISPSASVAELKDAIKKQINAEGKFLRLIHQGKMLSDDKEALSSYKVKTDDFIHCAMSAAPPKSVVTQMAAQENDSADREDENRRGFDRLRDRLSREEIQALRLYFYPQLSVFITQAERIPGESSEDHIYRLEEEWMAQQGPQSEFGKHFRHVEVAMVWCNALTAFCLLVALNVLPSARFSAENQMDMVAMNGSILAADNEGTGTEFLWGFLMGLLLGVFMLLMLLDRSVPRKQKIGLLLGVSMNFFLSVVPRAISE